MTTADALPPGVDRADHPDQAFPPVVYAPTTGSDAGPVRLAMHQVEDGRTALFVYSAMDRLVEMYGDVGWALLSIPDLQQAFEQVPYDVLYLDKRMVRTAAGGQ